MHTTVAVYEAVGIYIKLFYLCIVMSPYAVFLNIIWVYGKEEYVAQERDIRNAPNQEIVLSPTGISIHLLVVF